MKRTSFFARFGAMLAAPLAVALPAVPALETAVDDDAPFAGYGGGWVQATDAFGTLAGTKVHGVPNGLTAVGQIIQLPLRPSILAEMERWPGITHVLALDAGGVVREVFDVSCGIYAR